MEVITYCVDVGSTNDDSDSFAWARLQGENDDNPEFGKDIEKLISKLNDDMTDSEPITLGFECPLYQPIPGPGRSNKLSEGREDEGSRSCFAPAGGYSGFLGLHQLTYLIQNLSNEAREITLDFPSDLELQDDTLYLWEAFVSEEAHTDKDSHIEDAKTGGSAFMERFHAEGELKSDLDTEEGDDNTRYLSLAGTALLWNDPDLDSEILHKKTLVIRPDDTYKKDRIDRVVNSKSKHMMG